MSKFSGLDIGDGYRRKIHKIKLISKLINYYYDNTIFSHITSLSNCAGSSGLNDVPDGFSDL